ncbi:SDR family NAD(P)-dependent oxidoreductase [Citrobacter portucalensis]|uniref:SDR family NAD(P)-dependent oxidoreductase n=1 Tax=Citrobacter portucalensis TaxID=1639133 RepID=UPI00388F1BD5
MRVLVTGGSGYIGSHTCVQLLKNGHEVVILDNLCNSKRSVLPVIERLGGKHPSFVEGDIRNEALITEILHDHAIDTVIHFAGLKAVGESVAKPLEYYDNNVNGTLRLVNAMRAANVKNFIFSSSATVYGDQPQTLNRHAAKSVRHFQLRSAKSAARTGALPCCGWRSSIGRYGGRSAFQTTCCLTSRTVNPVGAHPSGDMGEDPQGIPNNLMPYIAQVAVGRRESLAIFGNDYPTEDGTGVRDYIHVMDLADGHVAAMEKLAGKQGVHIYNLGAGIGSSVLDVVNAFSKACGKPVNYHFAPRRDGDLPAYWADASKADRELNWRVTRTLDEMAQDTWHWQSRGLRTNHDAIQSCRSSTSPF